MRPVPQPTEIEVMANLLLGEDAPVGRLPPARGDGVRAALERVILPELQRSPCVVSFSGGRDSSAILAAATDVARRHGLPLPTPVTMRFPGRPEAAESHWQERVLAHLGLPPAEIVDLHDELDVLGPIAVEALRRNGALWPSNAYVHAPVLELARGGALLTGVGGDELLGTRAARHVLLLRRAARPRRADLREVPPTLRSRRARAKAWQRADPPAYPWLTPAGTERVHRALAADEVAWPHRWDKAVHHWRRSRAFAAVSGGIRLYAEPFGVRVVNPFVEEDVMAELIRVGGPTGFPSRAEAMRRLFGDLLPADLIARETKAGFTRALFGPEVRRFARAWDGSGVDRRWIDVERLRSAWLAAEPDFRSSLLLHRAWLQGQPAGNVASI